MEYDIYTLNNFFYQIISNLENQDQIFEKEMSKFKNTRKRLMRYDKNIELIQDIEFLTFK